MFPRPLFYLSAFYFLLCPFTLLAPAQTADPSHFIDISGDVVDSTGKPLPNATVIIPSESDSGIRGTLAVTRTDSASKFSFENIDHTKADASKSLVAFIPGVGISQPLRLNASPMHLQLAPSYDVQLTMLQEDGTPAQNVEMHITHIMFPRDDSPLGASIFMSEEKSHVLSAVTDAQGKCTFHGMPRNATLRFDTNDPRFARLWYGGQMPLQGDGPLVIAKPLRLTKASSISGRLLTPTGQPESARTVFAQSGENSSSPSFGYATTDANGQYTINQLIPGTYHLSLRERNDGPTQWVAPSTMLTTTADKPVTFDFKLIQGAIIKGQGRDSLTGKPFEDLDIGLYVKTPYSSADVFAGRLTDKEGNFEFCVPADTYQPFIMAAVPDGYLQPPNQGRKTVTVEVGQTVEVNFDIQPDPAPIIEGTVVDPDGKPLRDAWILIENPANHDVFSTNHRVVTDDQGHFHLHAQPGYLLRVTCKDLSTRTPIKIFDDKPIEIKLAVQSKFNLVVQLTDQEGKPATDATAILLTRSGSIARSSTPERKADAQGTVRFGPLPTDGKYTVLVNGTDYGAAITPVDLADLPQDAKEFALPISLKPATAEIAGIVVDETGKPFPDVAVTLNGNYSTTGQKETRTDANGHFSFHVIEDASADIYPHRDGTYSHSPPARVKAGQTDLNLLLPKSAP